ncbi:hypothetical protein [Streptomyces sp. NPDC056255]|uniref:hypothetical protein n=1 Tax=Streptomyces sp. NPDC056255 TaxID=3345764 RepID=UPI0035D589DB
MRHVLLAGACLAAAGILLLAPSAQAVGDDTGEEPQPQHHTVIMSNEEFEQLYGHEAWECADEHGAGLPREQPDRAAGRRALALP